MPALDPGSRWILKRGAHKGDIVSIDRTTKTGVFFRALGGGTSQGNQKVDPSQIHTLSRSVFLDRYQPEAKLAGNGETHTSFRRLATPRPAPPIVPPTVIPPKPGELNIDIVNVTPAMAQGWLDNGGPNRNLKDTVVRRYMAVMLRGEWRMTAEPIKLDEHGVVRDGQHRLAAVARSGLTIRMLVVRGVTEDAFDVMDSGKTRSPADVLAIHGYHATVGMAASVRTLMFIERFGHPNASTVEGRALNTGPMVLDYVQRHPEVPQVYHLAMELVAAGLQGGPGSWCAALVLFWRIDPDATQVMVDYLKSGAGMEEGHPLLTLRNRAVNRDARFYSRSAEGRQELIGIIIKAWNAWRQDQTLTRLTWRPHEYSLPEIYGTPVKQITIQSLQQAQP